MIHIERANPAHTAFVAKHLRQSDILELARAGRNDYETVVQQSVAISEFAFVALKDRTPLCVFGLKGDGILSRRARLWLLGTDEINTAKKEFVKTCRAVVDGLLDIYPILYNAVDANYPQAIRLLTFLGASFGRMVTTKEGNPFIVFEIRRKK